MMSSAAQPFDSSCARVSQRAESGSPCPVKFWGEAGARGSTEKIWEPTLWVLCQADPLICPTVQEEVPGGGRGDGQPLHKAQGPRRAWHQRASPQSLQQWKQFRASISAPEGPMGTLHGPSSIWPRFSTPSSAVSCSVLREHGCPSWSTS